MRPGRLLGEGRTAQVHEYGQGRVVKLLRPGLAEHLLRQEAESTAIAARAGAPAPSSHGLVRLRGRPGLVLSQVDGVSLLDLILDQLDRWREWAELMAGAHARILTLEVPQLVDLRGKLRARISSSTMLSDRQRQSALTILDSLEGADALLHGDFHPANVFVADGGEATVIDWSDSSRGPPAADVARTLHLVSPETVPPGSPRREEIMTVADEFRETYRRTILEHASIDEEEVGRWTVPVLAARLSEGFVWEREPILRKIESLI